MITRLRRVPALSHHCTALLLALVTSACASAPIARRATAITVADQEAHRAIEMENQIDASKIPPRTFAVLPFTVIARDTLLQPLGLAMSSLVVSDLAHASELQLVERMRLDAILAELDLVDAGLVDPRTAPRVGRLVGARRLLIGNISASPDSTITLSARLVDVIAGTVETLLTASAPLARVLDAEKALVMRIFEELGINLTAAERAEVEQRQTSNVGAMVAFGRGVDAEAHGDAREAVRRFEDAARLDAAFAMARTALAETPARTVVATPTRVAAAATPAANNSPDNAKKATSSLRRSGLDRVSDLAATAINTPVSTKLPEAADVPVQSQVVTLLITIKVP